MKELLNRKPRSFKFNNLLNCKDGMHISQDNTTVMHNMFIDPYRESYFGTAHRDAIQLILRPDFDSHHDMYRIQFCLANMDNTTIKYNHIISYNMLQGIFSSDGIFSNMRVHNNFIQTRGRHYITLSGVRSGLFTGNLTQNGEPAPILLSPARVGGNADNEGNDWILHIKQPSERYRPLNELVHGGDTSGIKDDRFEPGTNANDRYWSDLDLYGFRQQCDRLKPSPRMAKMILPDYARLVQG